MRVRKSFFTKNNSLNKGGKFDRPHNKAKYESELIGLYHAASPDIKNKMAEVILADREEPSVIPYIFTSMARLTFLIFILLFTVICYFAYDLMRHNFMQEAAIFSSISFISLLLIICKFKWKSKKPRNPRHYHHRKKT